MKNKIFTRMLCALLTVLTVVALLPAFTLTAFAAEEEEEKKKPYQQDFTSVYYESDEERLAAMTLYYENSEYALYVEKADDPNTAAIESTGIVAYVKKATGEILFTNPWDMTKETNNDSEVRSELLSQIVLTYSGGGTTKTLTSYTDAVQKGQVTLKTIKNGVRVEYAIGDRSARILVPMMIERTSFEEKILQPIAEALGKTSREYMVFASYFNDMFYTDSTLSNTKKESIAMKYPVTKEKNIDIYVCDINASTKQLRQLEATIMAYCPAYNFEELDNDHAYVNYVDEVMSPPVFKMALEYTLEDMGMLVSMSANGLRFDESTYRISNFQYLPYMGASHKDNEGYSFIPDGSGTLYALDTVTTTDSRVYGDDYSLSDKVYNYHSETVRMPVYGQVETDATTGVSRGYLAVMEEGESLAKIAPNHVSYLKYTTVIPTLTIRQGDVSQSGWSVYADSRYADNYSIRYMMLSDDTLAKEAGLTSYYECSWMGMACAYRDYLEATKEGYNRLTAEQTGENIPLYIETFGCVDTVKKVLSMPVTVSVALTSFDDIGTMYDYLSDNGVENVNFKLTGYANGGMYSAVPYKLKWEKAVGGKSDFKELLKKAADEGFGVYPDFDFVYTKNADGGSKVNMKKHAARTIDNRYTTKRVYSATYQTLVSYFQMVMSPVMYSHFYEKLESRYDNYDAEGISLGTLGNSLNSDYDEEKTALREEAKGYVTEALAYFKNEGYDVMVEGGNAYTWQFADHILNVPLDSSRYIAEKSSVPFMGVVLHGYVQFTGSAFNMEGNLTYAMLKAMENGASAYFVLSYTNTELLKEDELLSQNYSVRYDIWQKKLVEVYLELNSVLHDVQDKIIIDHESLNATSSRVPDADELLRDIEEAAAEQAEAIRQQIETDHVAKLTKLRDAVNLLAKAQAEIDGGKTRMGQIADAMMSQLVATNTDLVKAWNARRNAGEDLGEEQLVALTNTLRNWFRTYAVNNVVAFRTELKDAETLVVNAKNAYDLLREDYENASAEDKGAKKQILDVARVNLINALRAYEALLDAADDRVAAISDSAIDAYVDGTVADISALTVSYEGKATSVAAEDLEGFVFDGGMTASKYKTLGAEAIFAALCELLKADGLYTAIDVDTLIANASKTPEPEVPAPEEPTPDEGEGEGDGELTEEDIVVPDAPKDKYAVDNNVVAVTYGSEMGTAYKTLLLNFNDYAIKTTYNGVNYTIEAYGYVVITY